MSNISFYSYGDFIRERNSFKIVDRAGINRFDTPGALYYKLVFYFSDESGLLGLNGIDGFDTDVKIRLNGFDAKKHRIKNTAYNFLLRNDELERAEMLKNFLILLSEINTKSPWYFQEVSGIDAALERKVFSEGEMKIDEKPRQFTIKCLNDAYDDRIGTLLDLYRSSCFSYQNKKEIVPRNLRKFNMGILIFSAPMRGKGGKSGDKNNRIKIPSGNETNLYIPSTKLIEFRNCEIDYNSSKSAYGTLNTTEEPFSPQYTITINYDDCYESRYNEIMQEVITDFINIDINKNRAGSNLDDVMSSGKTIDYERAKINTEITDTGYWVNTKGDLENLNPYEKGIEEIELYKTREMNWSFGSALLTSQLNKINEKVSDAIELPSLKGGEGYKNIHDVGTVNKLGEFEYLNRMEGSNGIAGTLVQQAAGLGVKSLGDEVSKLYLGNLYEMSVSNILDITKRALSGDIAGTVGAAKSKSLAQNTSLTPKEELHGDVKQRVYDKPDTKEIWSDPSQRVYDKPDDEIWSDVQQRTIGKPDNEIWSDVKQRVYDKPDDEIWPDPSQRVIDKPDNEIWSDPSQRKLGFNPITEELFTDVQQRTYDIPETTQIPGYAQKRTNFFGKINKSKSLRNNL